MVELLKEKCKLHHAQCKAELYIVDMDNWVIIVTYWLNLLLP